MCIKKMLLGGCSHPKATKSIKKRFWAALAAQKRLTGSF